jgi:hypothetical protein
MPGLSSLLCRRPLKTAASSFRLPSFSLRERLKMAEKVCRAADAYVRYGNSPVAIGWDGLLDALGEWKGANDER